jgi:hypothetical protein
MLVETEKDRRKHQRLPLRLAVSCQKVGQPENKMVIRGSTINVSPGGVLMEIGNGALTAGELLSIEMSVPPTRGLLEYGGRISSYAKVVRVGGHSLSKTAKPTTPAQIALEFCESPKLRV